jgi:hypothetical protein
MSIRRARAPPAHRDLDTTGHTVHGRGAAEHQRDIVPHNGRFSLVPEHLRTNFLRRKGSMKLSARATALLLGVVAALLPMALPTAAQAAARPRSGVVGAAITPGRSTGCPTWGGDNASPAGQPNE